MLLVLPFFPFFPAPFSLCIISNIGFAFGSFTGLLDPSRRSLSTCSPVYDLFGCSGMSPFYPARCSCICSAVGGGGRPFLLPFVLPFPFIYHIICSCVRFYFYNWSDLSCSSPSSCLLSLYACALFCYLVSGRGLSLFAFSFSLFALMRRLPEIRISIMRACACAALSAAMAWAISASHHRAAPDVELARPLIEL